MLQAGPRAKSIPCRIELHKIGISYLGKEVITIATSWGGAGKGGDQADRAGEPRGDNLRQHRWLRDPLLWDGKTLLLVFNHLVLT